MIRWEIIRHVDKSGSSCKRRNLTTGEIQDFKMTEKIAKWLSNVEEAQEGIDDWKNQRASEDDMYNRKRTPPDEWS